MEIEIVAMGSDVNSVHSTFTKEAVLFSRLFPVGGGGKWACQMASDSWFGLWIKWPTLTYSRLFITFPLYFLRFPLSLHVFFLSFCLAGVDFCIINSAVPAASFGTQTMQHELPCVCEPVGTDGSCKQSGDLQLRWKRTPSPMNENETSAKIYCLAWVSILIKIIIKKKEAKCLLSGASMRLATRVLFIHLEKGQRWKIRASCFLISPELESWRESYGLRNFLASSEVAVAKLLCQ